MINNTEALRMPERILRDWNSAVMRTCEHCDSWHMTVIHTDGSAMCAGCCDAYYTEQLKETLTAALRRIAEMEAQNKRCVFEVSRCHQAVSEMFDNRGKWIDKEWLASIWSTSKRLMEDFPEEPYVNEKDSEND